MSAELYDVEWKLKKLEGTDTRKDIVKLTETKNNLTKVYTLPVFTIRLINIIYSPSLFTLIKQQRSKSRQGMIKRLIVDRGVDNRKIKNLEIDYSHAETSRKRAFEDGLSISFAHKNEMYINRIDVLEEVCFNHWIYFCLFV